MYVNENKQEKRPFTRNDYITDTFNGYCSIRRIADLYQASSNKIYCNYIPVPADIPAGCKASCAALQKAGSLLERYGTCSTHNCSPGSRKPVYSQDGIGPDTITGINTEIAEVNVYVRQEDLAETMPDVSGYTFGILRDLDRGNTDRALEQIYLEIGSEIAVTEYDSLTELADSLLNSASGAVILNRAYLDVLDQMEHYSSFSAQVREISSKKSGNSRGAQGAAGENRTQYG